MVRERFFGRGTVEIRFYDLEWVDWSSGSGGLVQFPVRFRPLSKRMSAATEGRTLVTADSRFVPVQALMDPRIGSDSMMPSSLGLAPSPKTLAAWRSRRSRCASAGLS